jgi:hypothetical protein
MAQRFRGGSLVCADAEAATAVTKSTEAHVERNDEDIGILLSYFPVKK